MDLCFSELKDKAIMARCLYADGIITRDEAKSVIMPYLEKVNEKSEELAKKYKTKAKKVSFTAFCR